MLFMRKTNKSLFYRISSKTSIKLPIFFFHELISQNSELSPTKGGFAFASRTNIEYMQQGLLFALMQYLTYLKRKTENCITRNFSNNIRYTFEEMETKLIFSLQISWSAQKTRNHFNFTAYKNSHQVMKVWNFSQVSRKLYL